MEELAAREACAILQDQNPKQTYDVEEYNWAPEAKRLGRDPDLH